MVIGKVTFVKGKRTPFKKLSKSTQKDVIKIRKNVAKLASKDRYARIGIGGVTGLRLYKAYTRKLEKMIKKR